MKNIKRMITVKNATIIVAFVFALGFGILRVFGVSPQEADTIILFVLSALIFWLLSEKIGALDLFEGQNKDLQKDLMNIQKGFKDLNDNLSRPNEIFAIYPSRDVLPPYKTFAGTTQEQVIIISIDLVDTSSRNLDNLCDLALRGCKVKLLAFNPESPAIGGVARLLDPLQEETLRRRIQDNIKQIRIHRDSKLPTNKLENLQVRIYDWTPTWVGMAVDPKTPRGKLLVGVCQHGPAKGNWPELELRHIGDNKLYDFYSDRFLQAWEEAVPAFT
jgi:hypothetical protein